MASSLASLFSSEDSCDSAVASVASSVSRADSASSTTSWAVVTACSRLARPAATTFCSWANDVLAAVTEAAEVAADALCAAFACGVSPSMAADSWASADAMAASAIVRAWSLAVGSTLASVCPAWTFWPTLT